MSTDVKERMSQVLLSHNVNFSCIYLLFVVINLKVSLMT